MTSCTQGCCAGEQTSDVTLSAIGQDMRSGEREDRLIVIGKSCRTPRVDRVAVLTGRWKCSAFVGGISGGGIVILMTLHAS